MVERQPVDATGGTQDGSQALRAVGSSAEGSSMLLPGEPSSAVVAKAAPTPSKGSVPPSSTSGSALVKPQKKRPAFAVEAFSTPRNGSGEAFHRLPPPPPALTSFPSLLTEATLGAGCGNLVVDLNKHQKDHEARIEVTLQQHSKEVVEHLLFHHDRLMSAQEELIRNAIKQALGHSEITQRCTSLNSAPSVGHSPDIIGASYEESLRGNQNSTINSSTLKTSFDESDILRPDSVSKPDPSCDEHKPNNVCKHDPSHAERKIEELGIGKHDPSHAERKVGIDSSLATPGHEEQKSSSNSEGADRHQCTPSAVNLSQSIAPRRRTSIEMATTEKPIVKLSQSIEEKWLSASSEPRRDSMLTDPGDIGQSLKMKGALKSQGSKTFQAQNSVKSVKSDRIQPTRQVVRNTQFKGKIDHMFSQMKRVSIELKTQTSTSQVDKKSMMQKFAQKVVSNQYFDISVGTCIVLNAIIVGIQVDWRAKRKGPEDPPMLFRISDLFFLVVFTVELLLRMYVERMMFVTGKAWRWNALDSICVASALGEEALYGIVEVSSVTVIRLLRMLRLARVIRGIRMLTYFRDLRVMINGIMACFKSLLWCILILLFLMFTVSVILLEVISDDLMVARRCDDEASCQNSELVQHFGDVSICIYSLFKSITSGQDWGELCDLVGSIHPALMAVFIGYIAFAVFTVLNIVTGVFVENASAFAQSDHENVLMEDISNRRKVMADIRKFFMEADIDGSGTLTWEEFHRHFERPQVQAYLRNLEINVDINGARGLFELLDFEGKGFIDVDTFVIGLTHLRGSAKSLDIAKLRFDNQRMGKQISDLTNVLLEHLEGGLCPLGDDEDPDADDMN